MSKPSKLELDYRAFRESLGDLRSPEPLTGCLRDGESNIGKGRSGRPANFKRGVIRMNLARRIPA